MADHPVVRRNILIWVEYDRRMTVSADERMLIESQVRLEFEDRMRELERLMLKDAEAYR